MKTFNQFLEESIIILEKYYEPDQKLPSGKTPISNANTALSKAFKNRKNENSRERAKKLTDKIRTFVRHGADNPQVNPNVSKKERKIINTKVDSSGYTNIRHLPSGVEFDVKDHGKEGYEIHWDHKKENLSPNQKVKIGVAADKVFKKHVIPRLRNNRLISTFPKPDDDIPKKIKKQSTSQNIPNKRAEIYARRGFSSRDRRGFIAGKVRKGKESRIVPISPNRANERTKSLSNASKGELQRPENLAANFDKNTEGKKPNKKGTHSEPPLTTSIVYHPNIKPKRKPNRVRNSRLTRNYSGNVARNNPATLHSLELERIRRDGRDERDEIGY